MTVLELLLFAAIFMTAGFMWGWTAKDEASRKEIMKRRRRHHG